MRALLHLVSWGTILFGCSGTSDHVSIERIEGAVSASSDVQSNLVVGEHTLAVVGTTSSVVFATAAGRVFRAGSAGLGAQLPLAFTSGEASEVGVPQLLVPRSADGFLLVASKGLFLDQGGAMVPSPFADALKGKTITSLSSVGQGGGEVLWYTTEAGAFVVRGGKQVPLSLGDKRFERIIGIDAARALGFVAGSLVEIDIDISTDRTVMKLDAPPSHDARDDEGNVYVATNQGVLKRSVTGTYSLRTLAPAGSPSPEVRALGAGGDAAAVALADGIVLLKDGEAKRIAPGAGDDPHLTIDGIGDTWFGNKTGLTRIATGLRVGFNADVAPFMKAHCMTCHDGSRAPARAFDTVAVSRSAAEKIVKRLHGDGAPVMPPANVEVLSPADINVFVRWVEQGSPE